MMRGRVTFAALCVLGLVACNAPAVATPQNPMAPTPVASTPPPATPPVAPIPTPTTSTITGTLTATNGGQPLGGVSVSLSGQSATTGGDGGFSVTVSAVGGSARIDLDGPSILPRSVSAAIRTRTLAVDAISLVGFDLAYYRQLVRNGFEQPATLQPIRRWTTPPRIYLRTVNHLNQPMDADSLELVAVTIVNTISLWSGGRMGILGLERGTETRVGTPGWVTVQWSELGRSCGQAQIGGGVIDLDDTYQQGCTCGRTSVSPATIRHELGHSMGFWHTSDSGDVMYSTAKNSCNTTLSDRERASAAIAYSRPAGNVDPDIDPSNAILAIGPMIR